MPTDPPGTFTEQNLAADRTAANLFYRIPALAHLGGGVVLAAWDARPGSSADAPNPNSIVQRRSTDNGRTWGPMTTVAAGHVADASGPKYGYSDPSYVVDAAAGKVFAFFVFSKDQGFGGSHYGNDDADRDVISAAVVESTDGGLHWSAPRLITSVVKPGTSATNPQPGDVRSMFASSGEGIQLRHGAHAGRLVQQYSGYVRQADGSEAFQAWSVYSDDHGATWVKGAPVGTGMDENKVVELSDGRVMLNSRDSAGSKYRKVAVSTDGGATYGPVTLDRQLIDPTNNGSVTRLFPDAATGSADARKLLFTNSASQTDRVDVTARVSCDDGATWPGRRVVRSGFSAYSTATRLADGQIGVFYEAGYTSDMELARFDDAWLGYVCAPLSAADRTVQAGSTTSVPVTVTNQEASTLSGGSVTMAVPAGWSAGTVAVPDVAPGASATVDVPLTVPSTATAVQRIDTVYTVGDGRTSHRDVVVTPQGAAQVGLTVTGAAPTRDVVASPYAAGERLGYTLTVTSTGNVTAASVPKASNLEANFAPPATPNCRYLTLAAGARYTCTPSHALTAVDVDRGWFTPTASFTVTASSDPNVTKDVSFTGAPVFLRDPATVPLSASVTGERGDGARDLATQPYVAGELLPYRFAVANTSPFVETVAPTGGVFAPLVPPGSGNCRWTNLAVGGSYTCSTPRHTVTQDEVDAGFFRATSTWTATATGKATVTYPVDGGEVDLRVRQPALAGTVTPTWVDVDGDRYASVGDRVEVVRTLGNAGNVSLTDVRADGADLADSTLGIGASSSATTSATLTADDVAAGTVTVAGFTASARNGDRVVTTQVAAETLRLAVQPPRPTREPSFVREGYAGQASPVDLGLEPAYAPGRRLTVHGLEYGRWYFLHLDRSGTRLGWVFPTPDGTADLIVPPTAYGEDTLVATDESDAVAGFGGTRILPPQAVR
ncbi:exo-alpha-sialidase [Intrasporangium flavum]|uniref:exo-alpha-sialidase n=1 Tax=Intrasporangium flavum TaxID=1428657 RepID=UPI001F6258E5|nr:exo-alpha-sialidase [Intrasporangium flavum]